MLIAKLDRCTRSVADLASLIDTFSRRGVALISAAESLDTSSAGGRLVVNVLGAVAQWEREATAERTSAALQVLRQQGRATGGVTPFGFQFIDGRREWHQGEQERSQPSSSTAAPASHGRRLPTSGTATGHRTRTGGQWTRQGAPPGAPGARTRARRRSVARATRRGIRPAQGGRISVQGDMTVAEMRAGILPVLTESVFS